jgi:hypothetical protein
VSGDRIWIVTDVHEYSASFHEGAADQVLFLVGAIDLNTNKPGYFFFSIDDARAIRKAGFPLPWKQALARGFSYTRLGHPGTEKGRYVVTVTPIDLDAALSAKGPFFRKRFLECGLTPNSSIGKWANLVAAYQLEKKIERAALAMSDAFSVRDLEAVVGKGVNVKAVIRRLLVEGSLAKEGKGRGTRYVVV